jgi:hypothetical protein
METDDSACATPAHAASASALNILFFIFSLFSG